MQWLDPARWLAADTGAPGDSADFRRADCAAGGQGRRWPFRIFCAVSPLEENRVAQLNSAGNAS